MAAYDMFLDAFFARSPEQATALRELFNGTATSREAAIRFASTITSEKKWVRVDPLLGVMWHNLIDAALALIAQQDEIVDLLLAIGELPDFVLEEKVVIKWSTYPKFEQIMKGSIFSCEWRYQDRTQGIWSPPRKISFAAKIFARHPRFDYTSEALIDLASAFERPTPNVVVLTPTNSTVSSYSSDSESSYEPSNPPSPVRQSRLPINTDIEDTKNEEEPYPSFHIGLCVAAQWLLHAGSKVYHPYECDHPSRAEDAVAESDDKTLYDDSSEDSPEPQQLETKGVYHIKSPNNSPSRKAKLNRTFEKRAFKRNTMLASMKENCPSSDSEGGESDNMSQIWARLFNHTVTKTSVGSIGTETKSSSYASSSPDSFVVPMRILHDMNYVPSSCAYIPFTAQELLRIQNESHPDYRQSISDCPDFKDLTAPYPSSWVGSPGFTNARWAFWKVRCKSFEQDDELPKQTRELARFILKEMDKIERTAERERQGCVPSRKVECFHF